MIRCLDPLVSLPAIDPRRAHDFYTRVLGLTTTYRMSRQTTANAGLTLTRT